MVQIKQQLDKLQNEKRALEDSFTSLMANLNKAVNEKNQLMVDLKKSMNEKNKIASELQLNIERVLQLECAPL